MFSFLISCLNMRKYTFSACFSALKYTFFRGCPQNIRNLEIRSERDAPMKRRQRTRHYDTPKLRMRCVYRKSTPIILLVFAGFLIKISDFLVFKNCFSIFFFCRKWRFGHSFSSEPAFQKKLPRNMRKSFILTGK